MRHKVIAVCDPAVFRPEIECFNQIASSTQQLVHYHLPALRDLSSLSIYDKQSNYDLAGIIVLGSSSSVYDKLPWQQPFHNWVFRHMQAGIPTLGLCYGHQLIAHLFGATVSFIDKEKTKYKEVRTLSLQENKLWGGKCEISSFFSHAEVVTTIPSGFLEIGISKRFSKEALVHNTLPIWTFQSHIEAVPAFLFNQGYQPTIKEEESLIAGNAIVTSFLNFCI